MATQIIKASREKADTLPGVRGGLIRVRVGQLSSINADNLRFCLTAAQEGSEAPFAVEVETVNPKLNCPACGEVDSGEKFDTRCPRCGETAQGFIGGQDIEVELEYDDSPPADRQQEGTAP